MPWHIGSSDSCPASKPYAVIKDADGSVSGCHATRKEAEAQMAALYANDAGKAWSSSYITALPDSAFACIDKAGRHYPHHDAAGKLDLPHLRNALSRLGQADTTSCGASHLRAHAKAEGIGKNVKADRLTSTKWRVLAIPYGGPFKGKDLDGEFFSRNTDIKPDWFDRRPLVWNHNLDTTMKADPVIGVVDDLEEGDDGWWVTAWMDRSHAYFAMIDKLLSEKKVFGSSGTIGHFVRKDHKSGEILQWPFIEETYTPTPANLYSVVVAAKVADHLQSAGIAVPDGLLAEPDSEPDLGPHLPEMGGDDPAVARLAETLDSLDAVLRRLRR